MRRNFIAESLERRGEGAIILQRDRHLSRGVGAATAEAVASRLAKSGCRATLSVLTQVAVKWAIDRSQNRRYSVACE
jgi:hypothetical protein